MGATVAMERSIEFRLLGLYSLAILSYTIIISYIALKKLNLQGKQETYKTLIKLDINKIVLLIWKVCGNMISTCSIYSSEEHNQVNLVTAEFLMWSSR